MPLGIAIVLWILLIVSGMFDSFSNQTTTGGNSSIGDVTDLDDSLELRSFDASQLGITGLDVGVPHANPALIIKVWKFLTWERTWMKDWLEPLRLIFLALTWWFTLWAVINFMPAILQFIDVIGSTIFGAVGGVAGIFRSLGRLR